MTQRNYKISLQLQGVSSPQELIRDLQDTHTHTDKTETTVITQHNCGHTGSPVSVWHRGRIIFSQTATKCLYILLTFDFPTAEGDSPWTLSFICLLYSLLQSFDPFLSASTCVFTSVPVQWDTPSGKPPHIQSQLSNKHLPSERLVKFQLLVETQLRHPWKIFNQNCIRIKGFFLIAKTTHNFTASFLQLSRKGTTFHLVLFCFAWGLGSSAYQLSLWRSRPPSPEWKYLLPLQRGCGLPGLEP